MGNASRKSYGWESVRTKIWGGRECSTVLGDTISKISLYRDGDLDELSVHKDEVSGVFTAVFYGKDGTRLIATGRSEHEACEQVRPSRV
jgi:hypothetical protein